MTALLTESEASRIAWTSERVGLDSEATLSTVCQIKSMLTGRASLMRDLTARIEAGAAGDVQGLRALVVMVKGALGGAIAGFAFKGLGTAVASFLGIAAAAEVIAAILFVVGAIMLLSSILELPGALRALKQAGEQRVFDDL
jgi:uncharacterized membrane protein YtjA (UPF0391 family)